MSRTRRLPVCALATCVALFAALPAVAAPVTIKLGSLAPINSPWDLSLKKIATEWARISGGSVTVRIYSGGTVGDEPDMIRKMRIGQLHAAGLTVRGLNQLYPGILPLALPLVVRTDDELDYVLGRMRPDLEAGLEEAGYKALFWVSMGWVHFYAREPVITPDDLRKQKLWVWEGDPEEASVWKDLNFRIVPLQSTDILTGLQSGMIDAFASSPLTAAAYQWFALAPHMSDMRWGPMFGGLVVSTKVWDRIAPELREKLEEAARHVGSSMRQETVDADREAIQVMQQYGLKIDHVPEGVVEEWAQLMDRGFSKLAGKSFIEGALEQVKQVVQEYRSRNAR